MKIRVVRAVLAGAVMGAILGTVVVRGDAPTDATPAVNNYKLLPHSDSEFAHELLRLGQVDSIRAEAAAAKGTPAENLWKAQEIVATWDKILQSRLETNKATAEYLASMKAYLDATPDGIDGVWAMDNAKFIYGRFSSSILDRMERLSNNAKDRQALATIADLGDRLIKLANLSLDAEMALAYAPGHAPDDAAYMRAYNVKSEADYYGAWGQYFKAMSMEPGSKERKDLLLAASTSLDKWADADDDNGVNKQALLLRGKVRSEAGQLDKAVDDLRKSMTDGPAETVKAPEWVKYQAQYQIIVTRIRAQDFSTAYKELEVFRQGLPKGNPADPASMESAKSAQMSTNMLAYRIAWAEAETKTSPKDKADGEEKAMGILAGIIKDDPRFRDLIFEQLVAQIPDGADIKTLMPMQQLAIAYSKSTSQKGDTPESRAQLQAAINAAKAVLDNASANPGEKQEARYLAGVCSAVINQPQDAVKYEVEFIATSPDDPRSKKLLTEAVMPQIGDLKALAKSSGTPLTPEMNDIIMQALALSSGAFHDKRYLFAQGRMFEDAGKLQEAAKAYSQIQDDDANYIDARYRLVAISTTRFSQLVGKGADAATIGLAANDVFDACSKFVLLLDNPPKGTPKDLLDRLRKYRTDILLIETATALNPAVKRPEVALDRIGKLEALKDELTDAQKGQVLRYKIEAYQQNGQVDKIKPLLLDYAKASGQNPLEVYRGLAVSTIEEIDKVSATDPDQAKRLADFAVTLFDPIIAQELKDSQNAADQKDKDVHRKNAFDLKEIEADMMVRAGDYKGATALCEELMKEDDKDIRSYMTEARASWLKAEKTKDVADYKYSQDYFTRIVNKVTVGVDAYWECWLRILECKEAVGGPGVADEIKKHLSDLKAISSNFGGEKFKDDFARLALKYGA